ncbi:hypothetical protein XarbCFBP7408_09190 [Xanthomonas arboricola pv. guizotiae]|uniref:Uncharacterized protein n=1 Tax=Xanthomonas arboricola pv. guizotiae TaxID=487867 RepID=A0A2S7A537_9XANT|nr:hypothetical protein XarbCFBP7409_05490 [Xanthomonas arboricola pv. guizotiae]PPU24152.1 hypothetical protein XarbCFBP7408_09190 [Xanthomonas arboricola pv. guizotiae]
MPSDPTSARRAPLATMHTDHLDRSLPAHRRVRAYMDVLAACPAMVGGQGPCSKSQINRSATDLSTLLSPLQTQRPKKSRRRTSRQGARNQRGHHARRHDRVLMGPHAARR